MNYKILYKNYPVISGLINEGERLKFNGVSVMGMSSNVRISKGLDVSFKDGIERMLNGEAPYWQYLTSDSGKGHFLLASGRPGVIVDLELSGNTGLKVVKESFLACTEGVNIGVKYEPITRKQLKRNRKLCTLTGDGVVFLSNFGEIHQINLDEGEEYFVDLNCVVAFPDYMRYSVEKATNGWMNVFSRKEQIMMCFEGPGIVLVQTCGENSYRVWNNNLGFVLDDDFHKTLDKKVSKLGNRIYEEIDSINAQLKEVTNLSNRAIETSRVIESRTMSKNFYDRDYSDNNQRYDNKAETREIKGNYSGDRLNEIMNDLPKPERKITGPNVEK